MINKNKLKAKAVELGITIEQLASDVGINYVSLYRKMNGKSDFTRTEIIKITDVLGLTEEDIKAIFFV